MRGLNSWREDTQKEHSDQQTENKEEFAQFMVDCKGEIKELEDTYQVKLRMKKPATYWREAARNLDIRDIYGLFS